MTRRLSIRRATTICPRPALHQVILKNTSLVGQRREDGSVRSKLNRSHSLVATRTRVSFLSPLQTERARLEALLADVWSREVLPFPDNAPKSRSERLVRASASNVMKRLNVASIASSWARKTETLRQRLSLDEKSCATKSEAPDHAMTLTPGAPRQAAGKCYSYSRSGPAASISGPAVTRLPWSRGTTDDRLGAGDNRQRQSI